MGQFGDTSLTKVFVGGLAWETHKEALREHFDNYGEILEAVIISDKLTGRSKGYGFVTFKEAEAAKKACEDATPVINGRRANCNLASLGARRLRSSPPATPTLPPHQSGLTTVGGSRAVSSGPPAQWFYPSGAPPPPSPYQHHHHYPGFPFYAAYGYTPSYMTDVGYNAKLGQSGGGGTGSYMQGQFSPAWNHRGAVVAPNGMVSVYPVYQLQQHQPQSMGVPTHIFPPSTPSPIPTIMSKPTAVPPPTTVEQVTSCN